jgi:hypothetical protein
MIGKGQHYFFSTTVDLQQSKRGSLATCEAIFPFIRKVELHAP